MQFPSTPSTDSKSNFLKLKSGESVTGVFRGDTMEFYAKWENKKTVIVPEGEDGGKFRFRINFITKENGTLVAKIWEQGAMTYNMLKELNTEYELQNTFVKITRHGDGLDTIYTIMPAKAQFTQESENAVATVKLNDLNIKTKITGSAGPRDDDEIPF